MTNRQWLACVAALVGVAAAPAVAQVESREGIALQNQILQLRRDLEFSRAQGQGQGQGGGGGALYRPAPSVPAEGSGELNAQLLQRVSQLEDQVRQLRGRIDEVENARQRSAEDLGKQIGDLQFKLNGAQGLGGRPSPTLSPQPGNLAPGTLAPPAPAPVPAAGAPRTPEIALQAGNAAFAQRDYVASEAAAREILASGRGPRITDAQYLLAQSLAGQRDYQAAAVAYDDAYNRNKRGTRAPDSLLGLANSLNAIGEKKAACQTLDKLRGEFAGQRADLRDATATARGRAACR